MVLMGIEQKIEQTERVLAGLLETVVTLAGKQSSKDFLNLSRDRSIDLDHTRTQLESILASVNQSRIDLGHSFKSLQNSL